MTDNYRERYGTNCIREIPPTTDKDRLKALENRMQQTPIIPKYEQRISELEHKVATLEKMFERMLEMQVVGKV